MLFLVYSWANREAWSGAAPEPVLMAWLSGPWDLSRIVLSADLCPPDHVGSLSSSGFAENRSKNYNYLTFTKKKCIIASKKTSFKRTSLCPLREMSQGHGHPGSLPAVTGPLAADSR